MPRATRRIAAVLLPICCVAPLGAFAYPRDGPLRSLRRIRVVQYPAGVRESLVPIENAAPRRTQYQIVKELCRRLSFFDSTGTTALSLQARKSLVTSMG